MLLKRTLLRLINLVLFLTTVAAGLAIEPTVETRVLPRSRPDRLYQLTIQVPASFREHPEKKYPVIFVTDGYWCFQGACDVCVGLTKGKHLPR